jgi:hypothetical protein
MSIKCLNPDHERNAIRCLTCQRIASKKWRQANKTEKVRGILCDFCNRSLGFVEKVGLDKITKYLEE